jgi:5-formyltetrahydrofolate cyclo-ligase
MIKAELRKIYLEKRKQLTSEELQQKSQQICSLFFEHFNLQHIKFLHLFLPILRQKEVDTWAIIRQVRKNFPATQLVIPKTDIELLSMESFCYHENMMLEENKWGLLEPVGVDKVEPYKLDMILIPLLAFDTQGYRVGYGKGYYDRFLEKCNKEIIKIGLSCEEPVAQIEDINSFDYRLNFCITPQKVWQFDIEKYL